MSVEPQVLTMAEAAKLPRFSKAHLSNVINGKAVGTPRLPFVKVGPTEADSTRIYFAVDG